MVSLLNNNKKFKIIKNKTYFTHRLLNNYIHKTKTNWPKPIFRGIKNNINKNYFKKQIPKNQCWAICLSRQNFKNGFGKALVYHNTNLALIQNEFFGDAISSKKQIKIILDQEVVKQLKEIIKISMEQLKDEIKKIVKEELKTIKKEIIEEVKIIVKEEVKKIVKEEVKPINEKLEVMQDEVNNNFKIMQENVNVIKEHMDHANSQFNNINQNFTTAGEHFDSFQEDFAIINEHLDLFQEDFTTINEHLDLIQEDFTTVSEHFDLIQENIATNFTSIGNRLNDIELRLNDIELEVFPQEQQPPPPPPPFNNINGNIQNGVNGLEQNGEMEF